MHIFFHIGCPSPSVFVSCMGVNGGGLLPMVAVFLALMRENGRYQGLPGILRMRACVTSKRVWVPFFRFMAAIPKPFGLTAQYVAAPHQYIPLKRDLPVKKRSPEEFPPCLHRT